MMNVRVLHFVGGAAIVLVWGCASQDRTSLEPGKDAVNHHETRMAILALAAANGALAKHPDDAEAYFHLGIAYSTLDSVGHAYTALMKSAEIEPRREKFVNEKIKRNFMEYYGAGMAAESTDEYLRAIMEYKKAASADPRRWEAHYQLAMSYLSLGQEDEARASLAKALERSDPESRPRIREALERLR